MKGVRVGCGIAKLIINFWGAVVKQGVVTSYQLDDVHKRSSSKCMNALSINVAFFRSLINVENDFHCLRFFFRARQQEPKQSATVLEQAKLNLSKRSVTAQDHLPFCCCCCAFAKAEASWSALACGGGAEEVELFNPVVFGEKGPTRTVTSTN